MDAAGDIAASAIITVGRPLLPRLPAHVVDRPQLRELLDATSALAVLRGPIGFGKTTLLSSWASYRAESERVAWIGLDEDDRAPGAFWRRMLDGLGDAGIRIRPAQGTAQTDRRRVQRAIETATGPLTVIIDRYDTSPDEVDHMLVDLLVRYPHLRLIAGLRSHRRLPPGARVGLHTVAIDAAQLRFTVEEIESLLRAHDVPDAAARSTQVHEQTDGWPALADALAEGLTSKSGANYVRSHLLPQMADDGLRRALLIASIPQPLTAQVMRELTDDDAAGDTLSRLESAGALFATDEGDATVYRIPRAMRAALHSELDLRHPDLAGEIHTRLARRHLAAAEPSEALSHALAAKDWATVVAVINKFWGVLLASHGEQLYEAFMVTPLDQVHGIRALACRDLMLRAPDDTLLELAPTALPDDPAKLKGLGRSVQVTDSIGTGIVVMMALRRRGLHNAAVDYSDRLEIIAKVARATHTKEEWWQLPAMYMQTGATRLLAGEFSNAIDSLKTGYHTAHESPMTLVAPDTSGRAALAWAFLGDTTRASKWLERHDAAVAPPSWLAPVTHSPASAARALVATDQLLPDEARSAQESLDEGPLPDESWAFLAYARAQYALIWGDAVGALQELNDSYRRHRAWLGDGGISGPLVASTAAELLISLGWGNQAREMIDGPYAKHLLLQVPRARLAVLTGRPRDVLQLGTGTAWARDASARDQREMLLLHAVAQLRTGDRDAAAASLRRAVRRARAGHDLRVFATVPADELATLADDVPESVSLLRHRRVTAAAPVYPDSVSVVTLTERESVVLKGVDRGQTMPQIAESLYVSYNTVKSQMRSLYHKLGARSRAEAVAQARSLGLLD